MIRDAAFWLVLIFVIAIGFVCIYLIGDSLNTAIQDNDVFDSESKEVMTNFWDKFPSILDYLFLSAFVFGLIGVLGLSWLLRANPVVFFALWIVVIILGLLAGYFANTWVDDISTDNTLSAVVTNFPIMDNIMSNLMGYVLVSAFLMLVVFFAKPNQEGYG